MAGIDSLVKGAVGTFAKDKVSPMLSPSQMDFLTFALNPQAYLLNKGVTAAADYLGYGNEYKELKAGAQDDKDYYKEVLRDTIGDALPNTIGDFIRATPRVEEAYDPYNGYYAQNIGDWVSTRDSTPEANNKFEDFVRNENYGTLTPGQGKYVGPLPEDSAIFEANVSNLPYELKATPVSGAPDDFDPALLASILRGDSGSTTGTGSTDDVGEMTIVGQKDSGSGGNLSYTDMIDMQNQTLNSTPNYGVNIPAITTPSMPDYSRAYGALGGAESVNNLRNQLLGMGISEDTIGSAFSAYYAPETGNEGIKSIVSEAGYRKGGQVCGCKH
jgi:hypothetical protein